MDVTTDFINNSSQFAIREELPLQEELGPYYTLAATASLLAIAYFATRGKQEEKIPSEAQRTPTITITLHLNTYSNRAPIFQPDPFAAFDAFFERAVFPIPVVYC